MGFKVRCGQCGKASQFNASDAGMTALCMACGARFVIPAELAAEAVIPDKELVDPAPGESLSEFVPAQPVGAAGAREETPKTDTPVTPPPLADVPPPPPARGRTGPNYALLYALLGGAVTAALLLL